MNKPSAIAAVAAAVFSFAATPTQAQDFPTKPVRIVTPLPVGSGPEGIVRLLADKLSRAWGQPVTWRTSRAATPLYSGVATNELAFAFGTIGTAFGYEPFPVARDKFEQYVQTESTRMAEVIKKSKASLD